jgi:excisionase family DNA binding protein
LSVADVAVLLGVSEWLVLQQVRRGGLPHRRVGRRILFSRSRLLTWLADTDAEHPSGYRASRPSD